MKLLYIHKGTSLSQVLVKFVIEEVSHLQLPTCLDVMKVVRDITVVMAEICQILLMVLLGTINEQARSLGIMCKLNWFLPQNILRILYNSLILPHLQYCVLSWGFKSDRIFKLQKRAVRIITCSKYNAHEELLLKTLHLLKIEDIMKTKALKLYYKYKRNELPKCFESMFTESNDNHSHDIRHDTKSLLYQLRTKTRKGRLCIRHYPGTL